MATLGDPLDIRKDPSIRVLMGTTYTAVILHFPFYFPSALVTILYCIVGTAHRASTEQHNTGDSVSTREQSGWIEPLPDANEDIAPVGASSLFFFLCPRQIYRAVERRQEDVIISPSQEKILREIPGTAYYLPSEARLFLPYSPGWYIEFGTVQQQSTPDCLAELRPQPLVIGTLFLLLFLLRRVMVLSLTKRRKTGIDNPQSTLLL
jgi:hypothetical protein